MVPPATDHAVTNESDGPLAFVSVQSPPVAAAELYSDQLAEVAGYDEDDEA
jgi:mannose-6-phosphate isomerase-like protein (cupin superfamily)